MDALFEATAAATEEAIINALVAAETILVSSADMPRTARALYTASAISQFCDGDIGD